MDAIASESSPAPVPRKKTPMPRTRTSDPTDYDDGERTTASITSLSSAGKNPFDDDIDKDAANNGLVSVETGRVKRFIRDMRTKSKGISCRNADTVVEESKYVF